MCSAWQRCVVTSSALCMQAAAAAEALHHRRANTAAGNLGFSNEAEACAFANQVDASPPAGSMELGVCEIHESVYGYCMLSASFTVLGRKGHPDCHCNPHSHSCNLQASEPLWLAQQLIGATLKTEDQPLYSYGLADVLPPTSSSHDWGRSPPPQQHPQQRHSGSCSRPPLQHNTGRCCASSPLCSCTWLAPASQQP
jgi:hypothetical protein